MNAHPHQFTAAASEDGMAHLCCSCDAPRAGPLAYCPSCEEVTESYDCRDDGSLSGIALTMFEADMVAELRRGDLGFAPTVQVGMGRFA